MSRGWTGRVRPREPAASAPHLPPVPSGPAAEPGRRTGPVSSVWTGGVSRRTRRVTWAAAVWRSTAVSEAAVWRSRPGETPTSGRGGKPSSRPRASGASLRSDRTSVHFSDGRKQRDGREKPEDQARSDPQNSTTGDRKHNKTVSHPETETLKYFVPHRQPAAPPSGH